MTEKKQRRGYETFVGNVTRKISREWFIWKRDRRVTDENLRWRTNA